MALRTRASVAYLRLSLATVRVTFRVGIQTSRMEHTHGMCIAIVYVVTIYTPSKDPGSFRSALESMTS